MAKKLYKIGEGAGGLTGRAEKLAKQTGELPMRRVTFGGFGSGGGDSRRHETIVPEPPSILGITFLVEESTPLEATIEFSAAMDQTKGLVDPENDWFFTLAQSGLTWRYQSASWVSPTHLKLSTYLGLGTSFDPQQDRAVYSGSGSDQLRGLNSATLPTGYVATHPGF
jgi:hypothetical protein